MKNKLSLYLLDNWKPKLISLFLALCVFFFYMFSTNSTRIVSIPLDVILPIEYEAESLVPTSVDLQINGNNNIIYLIDPTLVKATVDFSSVNKEGISNNPIELQYDETVFSKGNISLSTNPATVKVSFKEGL
ncbi:MAG: hypothetical protein PQJ45_06400 [Sphaerochaetaceae bacterium]|nr:hypothetical protein [Sphaerochaetaceae bacterium]MDC7237391.1 hypothetical protein [Sphaerochaetaceae bacterium]